MRVFRFASAAAVSLAAGCVLPFDVMGVEETTYDAQSQKGEDDPLADDKIEDKKPVFDPTIEIEESFGVCTATLNKSRTVTRMDIVPFAAGSALEGRLFADYAKANDAARDTDTEVLPSMEVVDSLLKPTIDGVYAATELAADAGGNGAQVDKKRLFEDTLAALLNQASNGVATAESQAASASFAAALLLAGGHPTAPPATLADAASFAQLAKQNPDFQPVGFYTWTPQLGTIFTRDKFLQVAPFAPVGATGIALGNDAALGERYARLLALYKGITNPFASFAPTDVGPVLSKGAPLDAATEAQVRAALPGGGVSPPCGKGFGFVPASTSVETRLFQALACGPGGLPPGNLVDLLIREIRAGRVDLTPKADSGFYDREVHALETLLVPDRAAEKDHLFLTKRYKQKLVETFKTLITQRRETHAKQLGVSFGGAADDASAAPIPFDVYPVLPVEPFPTFYLRTARALAFLHDVIESTMGTKFLSAPIVVEPGAPPGKSVGEELVRATRLVYGLHVVSAASIGMRPFMEAEEQARFDPVACADEARAVLTSWPTAPTLRDPRVILPVHNNGDGKITAWAVIGVTVLRTEARFDPSFPPKVTPSNFCVLRDVLPKERWLFTGKQVEVHLRKVPTREAFRALCDEKGDAASIVKALESL